MSLLDKRAPSVTRRTVLGSTLAVALTAGSSSVQDARIELIAAPSNLGLRPLRAGHVPGAWRAPRALLAAGLAEVLRADRVTELERPSYSVSDEPGTRIRNGNGIRKFSELLATAVEGALKRGGFPLVLGGDCSVLLGSLLGARRKGACGLVHVDGHSDFYHPGNYDAGSRLGSAAGMDLALATGRGELLLSSWDGHALVEDEFVVQIGERDDVDPNYAYADIRRTAIRRVPVRQALGLGMKATVDRALAPVNGEIRPFWLHVDLDVLDERVMPAVDSPGSPGLTFAQLTNIISLLRMSGRLIGMNVAIYDPDLDPGGVFGGGIVKCLRDGLRVRPASTA